MAEPDMPSKTPSSETPTAHGETHPVEGADAPAGLRSGSPGPADPPSRLPLVLAALLPVLFFFVIPPLTRAGLWDPHELNVADLARRVALNLHGASNLALEGADNSLPHLNDLGRP